MKRLLILVLAAAVAVVVAGCGSGSGSGSGGASSSSTQTAGSSSQKATVATSDSSLGTILVAADGKTLYLFEKDTSTKSTCSGACAKAWPPLTVSGSPTAGDGVDQSKLGTTMRADGTTQVTYAGHPLYFFYKDQSAGDTNGQGVDGFGAKWWVVGPSGQKIEKSSSGGGYGY
jgi:predicted lipoprotein with Yx(FWY)xxD motif